MTRISHCLLFPLSLILALTLSLSSCKQKHNVAFDEMAFENIKNYIYAFSSGTLSRAEPIVVKFTEAIATQSDFGKTLSKDLLQFKPNIKGKTFWKDENTLVFEPENILESDQSYTATLQLGEIIKGTDEIQDFQFAFETPSLFLQYENKGLQLQNNGDSTYMMSGLINSSDFMSPEEVEPLLSASFSEDVKIEWAHSNQMRTHQFDIQNINRADKEKTLQIEIDNKGVSNKEIKEKIKIPALSDFKVNSIYANKGNTQELVIEFSDRINSDQMLSGLVNIIGKSSKTEFPFTLKKEKNQLIIYPNQIINEQSIRNR